MADYVIVNIVCICMFVGYIIKELIPSQKINRFIPFILGILGVLINVWHNDFAFNPDVLLGGLASGLAATGSYELVKNTIKEFKGI